MRHFGNVFRFSLLALLITSVGAMGLGPVQNAWAMPGPLTSSSPTIVATGNTFTITFTGLAAFVPTDAEFVRVIEPFRGAHTEIFAQMNVPTVAQGPPGFDLVGVCDPGLYDDVGLGIVPVWELQRGGARVGFTLPGNGDSFSVTFGTGLAPTVIMTGGASVTPGAGVYDWVQQAPSLGLIADNTNTEGSWLYGSCGTDFNIQGQYSNFPPLLIQPAVAGEIIPISTTSLLIAGFNANALWMLPALAIIGGVAFTVLRFQVYRK